MKDKIINRSFLSGIIIMCTVFLIKENINGQDFGRNKPVYTQFNFKIKETPAFDIYYYIDNEEVINEMGKKAEKWYKLHQVIFRDTITKKNPILIYENQADFQQTNAINGSIGVGTGGVTEALKNRVIIPLTFSNQQNDHVLGHELVHAFQYNLILNSDSTSMNSFQNLPLWLVEGLAEYLSKGRVDPFTAMWMRDATLNNDIPTLNKLDRQEYFPYRYGQAFWSFLTGKYGDQIIRPFFRNTAIYGMDMAIPITLQIKPKELSEMWVQSVRDNASDYMKFSDAHAIGKKLIDDDNAGEVNVSPSISPNGKYFIFISEKDIFSTDWYLANAVNGKIIKKITSKISESEIDDYNFLESGGAWSPNSEKFAYVAFSKGKNILIVEDVASGKKLNTYKISDLRSFTNPVWKPDGTAIILTGSQKGQTDLFEFNLKTKKLSRLTDDKPCELQSCFSTDGKKLVFATDAVSLADPSQEGKLKFNIAIMDYDTKSKSNLRFFPGADNLNPLFDKDNNIYFLSNRDGFRNLYQYEINTGKIFQKTDITTGISGITEYSPAISISPKTDKILYTVYFDKKFSIYEAKSDKYLSKEIDPLSVDLSAGTLPNPSKQMADIVNTNLNIQGSIYNQIPTDYKDRPYRPKFRLDYVGGGTSMGVGNRTYGVSQAMLGGIDMLFSDMLGNNQFYSTLAINGEIYDFGGQAGYMNRKSRINWGAGISHIPNSLGYYDGPVYETVKGVTLIKSTLNLLRIFDDRVNVFAHYPFSPTLRLEGGIDAGYRSFRYDQINDYYDPNTYQFVFEDPIKVPVPDTISLNNYINIIRGFSTSLNLALVGDNSYFGFTSPLAGYRYKLGMEKYFGADNFTSIIADGRYYIWKKPVCFAFRALSYNRFENAVNSIYPLYIGDWGLVRGYNSFTSSNYVLDNNDFYIDQLYGSKILLGNFEIRFPFSGLKRLSLINSRYFVSDLSAFFDIGTAFDEFSHFTKGEPIFLVDQNGNGYYIYKKPKIAKSAGISLRVNLFGALIVEPYLAYPFEKNTKIVFGLNLTPGF